MDGCEHWQFEFNNSIISGLIVALLLIAAACCMGSSLSLQKVIKSYDNKCLLGTTLYFDAPSSSALLLQQQVNETATTLSLDCKISAKD